MNKLLHPWRQCWKFELKTSGETIIEIESSYKVVMIDWQHGKLFLWAEVDVKAEARQHHFFTVMTGQTTPPGLLHLGSVQLDNGAGYFVVHIYGGHV